MPIPVYSYRFVQVAGFTGSVAFEVPVGNVAVVRDIDIWCPAGIGASYEAGLGGGAVFDGYTFEIVAVQATHQWRGRYVLNAGEQLVLESDAALDMSASGYLLFTP